MVVKKRAFLFDINETITGTTTLAQSGLEINVNKGVLNIP